MLMVMSAAACRVLEGWGKGEGVDSRGVERDSRIRRRGRGGKGEGDVTEFIVVCLLFLVREV